MAMPVIKQNTVVLSLFAILMSLVFLLPSNAMAQQLIKDPFPTQTKTTSKSQPQMPKQPAVNQNPVLPQYSQQAQQFYRPLMQQPQKSVMIILDSSYSMAEDLPSGENKMVAAKRVILDFMKQLPPDVNVGLRVYGNRQNKCNATVQLVPIGRNNRHFIASQMVAIKPTGATPISYSLQRSMMEDFYNVPGEKSIILVSDGQETCGEDPCGVSLAMVRNGVDIKINVVGFGLHNMDAAKQLKCVALSTYGKFYTANTSAQLADSLKSATPYVTEVRGQIIRPANQSGR